jgi:hypothetical protein
MIPRSGDGTVLIPKGNTLMLLYTAVIIQLTKQTRPVRKIIYTHPNQILRLKSLGASSISCLEIDISQKSAVRDLEPIANTL